ncbi:MAG: hypothetical protein WC374_10575 [Phycisphaerae bacterium]|jgi:hypothetical protein
MNTNRDCDVFLKRRNLELAKEIERLKKREYHNCATILHLRDYVKKANDEIKALKEVLSWYADEKNYLRGAPGENTPRDFVPPAWICDVGERARNALKGGE